MATVKTAISIQKSLFVQVDALAEEMQIPRSQLFVLAVEEFIKRHESRKMLDSLNKVYADESDPNEERLQKGMRRRHRQLVDAEW